MNKAWITGLTLAGVAGSAGAAFAGIAADNQGGSSVEAQGLAAETSTSAAATQTATYQVGAAGTVTLTAANGAITVDSALPGAYWTLVGYGTPAAHVEVQFADAAQQVTFIADLVNDDVVVSVTNIPAPGATTTSSIEVTQITNGGGSVAAPQPATPAANKPIVVAVPAPGASHTTATSSAGHDDDEDEHEEEHEEEDEGDDD